MCTVCCAAEKSEDPFIPELEPVGFFPPPQRKRPLYPFVVDDVHRLPPADGVVPNSVIISLLFPEKTLVEAEQSPSLTASQGAHVSQFGGEVQCYLCC